MVREPSRRGGAISPDPPIRRRSTPIFSSNPGTSPRQRGKKRRGLVAVIALAMSFPVGAAEQQSEQSLGSQQQTYTPSLAVVMGLIQTSHFKLWLAGNLRNWPLAEYQLSQMRATLHDCRLLFPNVAVADTSAISRSAEEFLDA